MIFDDPAPCMNVSRAALMRCIIRDARETNPTDPEAALNAIVKSSFTSEVPNGTTFVSTASYGLSVSFQLTDSLRSADVKVLVEEALTWLESQPAADVVDPANSLNSKSEIRNTKQMQNSN